MVRAATVAARVAREIPFMATETLLMEAALRGGDRQHLHEKIRLYSLEAQAEIERGGGNPLLGRIAGDPDFRLSAEEIGGWIDPAAFTGRSAEQVDEFLAEAVEPALAGAAPAAVAAPRV